jgi:hypothetical protein
VDGPYLVGFGIVLILIFFFVCTSVRDAHEKPDPTETSVLGQNEEKTKPIEIFISKLTQ